MTTNEAMREDRDCFEFIVRRLPAIYDSKPSMAINDQGVYLSDILQNYLHVWNAAIANSEAYHADEIAKYDAALTQNDIVIIGLHEEVRKLKEEITATTNQLEQTQADKHLLDGLLKCEQQDSQSLRALKDEYWLRIEQYKQEVDLSISKELEATHARYEAEEMLATANARIEQLEGMVSVKDAALKLLHEHARLYMKNYEGNNVWDCVTNAISATAETVAAFRDKMTEPLRREMLVQYAMLCRIGSGALPWSMEDVQAIINNTQATAKAYEQEVEQRGAVKALEYAQHKESCKKLDIWSDDKTCSCGLDKLLNAVKSSGGDLPAYWDVISGC